MTVRWRKSGTLSNRYCKTCIVSPYSCALKEAGVSQTHDSLTGRSIVEKEETPYSEHNQKDETTITKTFAENPTNPETTPLDVAYRSIVTGITVWVRARLRRQMRKRKGKKNITLDDLSTELYRVGCNRRTAWPGRTAAKTCQGCDILL